VDNSKVVSGFANPYTDLYEADGTTRLTATSIDDCRQKAVAKNMVGFIYRNQDHPIDEWKGVCSGLSTAAQASGNLLSAGDNVHYSGCTDTNKQWGNCTGNVLGGWAPTYDELFEDDGTTRLTATSLDDCRQKAAAKGKAGFIYRHQDHPTDEWKGVCSGISSAHTSGSLSSVDDGIHFTGCTDASRAWGNCA
jgi:hypothetical protein